MNERENDRRALIPYAKSYPVQVQAAGRQLSIAAQLTQDIERGRLVALLKRISARNAVEFLSACQALDGDLIEGFSNRWEWGRHLRMDCGLSANEALPWSHELLERFEDRWGWEPLSKNEAIPWSLELLGFYKDRLDWRELSRNEGLPWSLELLERFADRLNWGNYGLSENKALPWSLELLERFEDRWCWNPLSKNEALPWSLELLERFEDRWNWGIVRSEVDENMVGLSANESLPWSLELLERFLNRWDGKLLAKNKAIPWSLELYKRITPSTPWSCFSRNEGFPWTLELLERLNFSWNWGSEGLSDNEALPWSLEFLERFENRWNWRALSKNKAVPWSIELIERNKVRLDWYGLSMNEGLPWSLELLERFEDSWKWTSLSSNNAVPWSLELLERFEDRWDWKEISKNKSLSLPLLRPVDIAEIMEHHFKYGDSRSVADGAVTNRARRMMPTLSQNTRAILLLTAPLIDGNGSWSSELLTPVEYKRLARHLHEIQRQPADLVLPDASELLRACQPVIEESRLQRLLGRGFLLSQVIKRWQARAIWVISRADAEYPHRLKKRFREDTPAVLYGCGDIGLLDSGGMAVVGTRDSDESLIDYTMAIGKLAARALRTIVSGGAKGIDQAAMRGALEAGGKVCSVLVDSLEKTSMNRENRNLLLDGQLVLISPYDPCGGFNVGKAMQRNKLIYALADASLVVSSDLDKGGTWCGAVEQLDKLKFVPVYVRSTGESSVGLDALRGKGAIPWPNPQDADEFENVFNMAAPVPT